jgi:hypothetical protein
MKTPPTHAPAGHAFERFTPEQVLTLVRRRARRIQRILQTSPRPTLYPARHA